MVYIGNSGHGNPKTDFPDFSGFFYEKIGKIDFTEFPEIATCRPCNRE